MYICIYTHIFMPYISSTGCKIVLVVCFFLSSPGPLLVPGVTMVCSWQLLLRYFSTTNVAGDWATNAAAVSTAAVAMARQKETRDTREADRSHHFTPRKTNIEPTNHPFRKEHNVPNLHDYVPC